MSDDEGDRAELEEKTRIVSRFRDTCASLADLGFLPFLETLVMEILYNVIEKRIGTICTGVFDECFVESYIDWLGEIVSPWLKIATTDSGAILLLFGTSDNR